MSPGSQMANGGGAPRRDDEARTTPIELLDELDDEGGDAALINAISTAFGEVVDSENVVVGVLRAHLLADPGSMEIASDRYEPIVRMHLQLALDELLADPGCSSTVHGFTGSADNQIGSLTLAQLCAPATTSSPGALRSAPEYVEVQTSSGSMSLLQRGLVLAEDGEGRFAVWICPDGGRSAVDVMAPTAERATAIVDRLRAATYRLNPFAGQVITIWVDCGGTVHPRFIDRPRPVGANDVVLPEGLLERIEHHALGVSAVVDLMQETGHSMKRGILLHGRPGVGKSHVIRYLIGRVPEHTVLTLSAARMGFVDRLAEILQYLTPGVIVLDDVDVIAEDRSEWITNPGRGPLFSLLELMDGIGADHDVLFILTTNAVDRLEQAITSRPGRVDQAFELPPPDADCRRRLFELYTHSFPCQIDDLDAVIDRTAGVTGAFMSELARQAALIAIVDGDGPDLVVTDVHVAAALDQLLDPANSMTARLLGRNVGEPVPSLAHATAVLEHRL